MKLFEMFGDVLINDKATKTIAAIGGKASELGSKLTSGIATAAKWGAGLAAGATAVVGGMVLASEKVAATTDRIDKLSQRLGVSREGFQEWEFVLSQSGSSMESLQSGMKVMVQKMAELKEGTGAGAEALGKLGVKFEDIKGMKQEQVFDLIVKKFNQMEDGAEKAALAQDIFSRSGQELLPLLNANADAVENMKKQSHELGLVLDDETIDAGVKFTDTMDQVKRSLGTLSTQFSSSIMPVIQKFLDLIIDNMPAIKKVMSEVFNFVGKTIDFASESFKKITPIVIDFAIDFLKSINYVLESLKGWLKTNNDTLSGIALAFNTVIEFVKDIVLKGWNFITNLWEENSEQIFTIADKYLKLISEGFTFTIGVIEDLWDRFGGSITAAANTFMDNIKVAISTILDVIEGLIDTWTALLEGNFEAAGESFKGIFVDMWNGILEIFANIYILFEPKLIEFKNNVVEFFTGMVDDMIEAGGNIIIGLGDGIIAGKDAVIAKIKGVGSDMISGFKEMLGINSPSKVFSDFGGFILEGLTSGITNGLATIKETAANLGTTFLDGFKDLMGIHSKSTEMVNNGGFIIEGLVDGVVKNLDQVQVANEKLINTLQEMKEPAVTNAAETGKEVGETLVDGIVKAEEKAAPEIGKSTKKYLDQSKLDVLEYEEAYDEFYANIKEEQAKTQEEQTQKDKEETDKRITKFQEYSTLAIELLGKIGIAGDQMATALTAGVSIATDIMSGNFIGAANTIVTQGDTITKSLSQMFIGAKDDGQSSSESIAESFKIMAEEVGGVVGELITFISDNLTETLGKAVESTTMLGGLRFKNLSSDIQESIQNAVDAGKNDFEDLVNTVQVLFDKGVKYAVSFSEEMIAAYNSITDIAKTEADKLGDAIITALETKYKKEQELEKQAIEDRTDLSDEEKANRIKAIDEKYDIILDGANLENEALLMATKDGQDAIVELLETYNPKWQDVGQSFGEKLVDGLNSMKVPIQSAVNEILRMVGIAQEASATIDTLKNTPETRTETPTSGYATRINPTPTPIPTPTINIYNSEPQGIAENARQARVTMQQMAIA